MSRLEICREPASVQILELVPDGYANLWLASRRALWHAVFQHQAARRQRYLDQRLDH
jgi:hypothetical protein